MSRALAATQRGARRVSTAVAWRVRRPWAWARHRATRMPLTPLVAPADPLPSCAVFHDIPVVSQRHAYAPALRGPEHGMSCGPVWPETGPEGGAPPVVETWMRHCRHGRAWDDPPPRPTGPMERIERPCVWLGYMHMQFGHLVSEHLTRALWSRTSRPDDLYLYVLPPKMRGFWPNYHFLDLLAWYGLPITQIRRVTAPVLATELRIYPQSELLMGAGPTAEYLDLLDRHVVASGLQPAKADVVYVTRRGMLARHTGSHAGEGHLCDALTRAGVTVVNPARMSLHKQLRAYAGARCLVFAEGSALHGRQLLGRIDQDIVVLNRRPGARTAMTALTPRCRDLRYVEACRDIAIPQSRAGNPYPADGLSFLDLEAVFSTLSEFGVDLAQDWDGPGYRRAVAADCALWVDGMAKRGRDYVRADLEVLARDTMRKAVGDRP